MTTTNRLQAKNNLNTAADNDYFGMAVAKLEKEESKRETLKSRKAQKFSKKSRSFDSKEFLFESKLQYKNKKIKEKSIDEIATSDRSSPDKSGEAENVFESYILPGITDFQLDFRQKLVESLRKDHNHIRNSYLNKLTQKKVWLLPKEKPKVHQTVFIFDWDDTLLCTTFLNPDGYVSSAPLAEQYRSIISKLDEASSNILTKSIEQGKVFIITNAAEGWVQFSAKKYLPEVEKLLSKVTVISARSTYEKEFPGDSFQWKNKAFLDLLKEMELEAVTNLIAIGDSLVEMEASKQLALKFPIALLKTVKFREAPSPEELVKQLSLVYNRFEAIYSSSKNLTVRLERREKSMMDQSLTVDKSVTFDKSR